MVFLSGGMWSPDIKNAFPQAAGFQREVRLRAPVHWGPGGTNRIRKLHAPAYGLGDAPEAFFERCAAGLCILRAPAYVLNETPNG